MVFPKNNLPTDAQPWTRDVEKRVVNLESSFRSSEVNNVTRDSQALSQIRRLDAAVTEVSIATATAQAAADAAQEAADLAQTAADDAAAAAADALDAINAAAAAQTDADTAQNNALAALQDIIDLGSPGGPTINASNITAGTLSGDRISGGTIDGVNFETTGGTESITLSGGRINFFEGGFGIGSMSADTDGSNDYIQITSGTGVGQLTVGSDYTVLAGSGCAVQPGVASFGRIDLSGTLVFCNANLEVNGYITANNIAATNFSNLSTGGSLTRTAIAGQGTTTANITDGGNFVRGTSSARYKQDIKLLDINLNDLYALEPKTFKRNEEVEQYGQAAKDYPGFIAEELAGTSLDKFVFYSQDEDGNPRPEGIHYQELTAALLLAIKDLNARIQVLEGRV